MEFPRPWFEVPGNAAATFPWVPFLARLAPFLGLVSEVVPPVATYRAQSNIAFWVAYVLYEEESFGVIPSAFIADIIFIKSFAAAIANLLLPKPTDFNWLGVRFPFDPIGGVFPPNIVLYAAPTGVVGGIVVEPPNIWEKRLPSDNKLSIII